eukprot:TRINITY_DN16001_c0_g3_i1.p1 TRINITY_DN16001_c0_g3~~TRINITY_DN16001_c0_g3_i1.p1  ORF type:complete len:527 (-),score=87.94 TRINITY_DN16001_c0_g3_i1:102-1625(-)
MAATETKQFGMSGQWLVSESSPASGTPMKPRTMSVAETCSVMSEASREHLLRAALTPSASTRGEESCAESLTPLLKASPPIPVGRLPGRYKVKLWRSTTDQPLGLAIGLNSSGITVMAQDAPHFGLRAGDEVLSINSCAVQDLRQCGQLLEGSQSLEMHLYHKETRERLKRGGAGVDEMKGDAQAPLDRGSELCCQSSVACEPQAMPECCDAFFNPPESRCKATDWPLRELLSTSGPFTMPGDGSIFRVQLTRTSLRQPFGLQLGVLAPLGRMPSDLSAEGLSQTTSTCALPFSESFASSHAEPDWADREASCEEVQPEVVLASQGQRENLLATVPSETSRELSSESLGGSGPVMVLASMPHLGLLQGDELLMLNGVRTSNLRTCKVALKHAMTIILELRRPSQTSPVVAATFNVQRNLSSQAASNSPVRRIEDWQSVTSDTKDCSGVPDVAEPAPEGWFGSFLSSLQAAFCSETGRMPVDSFTPEVSRMPTEGSHAGKDIVQVANF